MSIKNISVIGLGYIGLPTAAVFAAAEVRVMGVDVNEETIKTINSGKIHIVEPGLDEVVAMVVANGSLTASSVTQQSDAFIIAVPTPLNDLNQPDVSYIENACQAIAPVLKKGDLIILESTSPIGTTEKMASWLQDLRVDLKMPSIDSEDNDVFIAHCPERVLPGQVMRELIDNDRIIGGVGLSCAEKALELYSLFVKGECVLTTARVAEMSKLAENSFRDVNIAYANELSMICGDQDIDVRELITLANRHPRVNILHPGPGVGGHCIAVDPWFIVNSSPKLAKLIRTSREVNLSKPEWVIDNVIESVGVEAKILCLGLAFKPDIDDLRESPAIYIVNRLISSGLDVDVVEPNISEVPLGFDQSNVRLVEYNNCAFDSYDAIVVLVAHSEFRSLDLAPANVMDFVGLR